MAVIPSRAKNLTTSSDKVTLGSAGGGNRPIFWEFLCLISNPYLRPAPLRF